jgi:hypothetical protein
MDAAIRTKSLALTVIIHGLILLALLFFVVSTHIPPFDEGTLAGGGGGGTIVDFGEVPIAYDAAASKASASSAEQNAEEETYITSETEESTPVDVPKKDVKKIKDKKQKNQTKEMAVKTVIKVPTVDPRNIFHKSSQGSSPTANAGDQGDRNGQKGGSMFPGMGGSGGGTGTGIGIGPGPGVGAGNGPFAGLYWGSGDGRAIISAPVFRSKTNEPGKVKLKIIVDENGNVTRVDRESVQTLNPTQIEEAIEYVKKVKFSKGHGISVAYPTIEFSAK